MKKVYRKGFETKGQATNYYNKVRKTQEETRQYHRIAMGFDGEWFVTWQYK